MTEYEDLGNVDIHLSDHGREPLIQFCARLSEQVSRELLSTWSMLDTLKRYCPELPEQEVIAAALTAMEDRKKERQWKD